MVFVFLLSLAGVVGAVYSINIANSFADKNRELESKMKKLNSNMNFLRDQNKSIKKKLQVFKENILENKDTSEEIISKLEKLEEQIIISEKKNVVEKSIINKEQTKEMKKTAEKELENMMSNLHKEILGNEKNTVMSSEPVKEKVIESKIGDKKELVVEMTSEEFIKEITPKEEVKQNLIAEEDRELLEKKERELQQTEDLKKEEKIIEEKVEVENNLKNKEIKKEEINEVNIIKEDIVEEKNNIIKEKINIEEEKEKIKLEEAKEEIDSFKIEEEKNNSTKSKKRFDEEVNYYKRESKKEKTKQSNKKDTKKKILEPTGKSVWSFDLKGFIDKVLKFEYWLNVLGIIMLAVGVVLIFIMTDAAAKIPEAVIFAGKIILGLSIGTALEFFGFKLIKKRKIYSQLLLGGGICIFYIVIYGGFHSSIFIYLISMIIITVYALVISIKQNEMALSLLGFLGGILTPFLLGQIESVIFLMVYLTILIIGAGLIYLYKGWISFLWVIALSTLALIIISVLNVERTSYKIALQFGMVIYSFVFWLIPLLREIFFQKDPDKWKKPDLNYLREVIKIDHNKFIDKHVHLLIFIIPITCLYFSMYMWRTISSVPLGSAAMILSCFYFFVASLIRKNNIKDKYDATHMFVAVTFLTSAFVLLFNGQGEILIAALAIEGLGILYLSDYLKDKIMKNIGVVIFITLAIWLEKNVIFNNQIKLLWNWTEKSEVSEISEIPFLNHSTFMYVIVIVCGLLSVKFIKHTWLKKGFKLFFGHISILSLIILELSPVKNSYHFIALAWSIQTLAEYVIANKQNNKMMKNTAHVAFGFIVFLRVLDYIKIIIGRDFLYETQESLNVLFDIRSTVDIIIIIIGFLMCSMQKSKKKTNVYKFFSYLAIFGLAWREFYRIDSFGLELVLIAWTIEVLVMHLIAYKKKDEFLENTTHYAFMILGCIIGTKILYGVSGVIFDNEVLAFLNKGFALEILVIATAIGLSYLFDKYKKTIYQFVAFNFLFIVLIRESIKVDYGLSILIALIVPIILYVLYNKKDNIVLKNNFIVLFLLVGIAEIGKLAYEIKFDTNIMEYLNFYLLLDILVLIIGYVVFRKSEFKKYFMLFAYIMGVLLITKLLLFTGLTALIVFYFIYFMTIEYLLGKFDYEIVRNSNTALLSITFLAVIGNEVYEFIRDYSVIEYKLNFINLSIKFVIVAIILFNIFRRRKTAYFKPLILCLHTYLLILLIKEFTLIDQSYNILIFVLAAYTMLVSQISKIINSDELENMSLLDLLLLTLLFMCRAVNYTGDFDLVDGKLLNIITPETGGLYALDLLVIFIIGINSKFTKGVQRSIGIFVVQVMTIFFTIVACININMYFILLIVLDLFLLYFTFVNDKVKVKINSRLAVNINVLIANALNILLIASIIMKFMEKTLMNDILIGIVLLSLIAYTYIDRKNKALKYQYIILNVIVYLFSISVFINFEWMKIDTMNLVMLVSVIFALANLALFTKLKNEIFDKTLILFMIVLGLGFIAQVPWLMIYDIKFFITKDLYDIPQEFMVNGIPLLNIKAIVNLAFMFVIMYRLLKTKVNKLYLEGFLYIGTLLILYREFRITSETQGLVSIAWGLFAVAVLIYGLRKGDKRIFWTTIITLLLIVVKIIFIDFKEVGPVTKVILFMGFGVLFILISYFMQILWKPKDELEEDK